MLIVNIPGVKNNFYKCDKNANQTQESFTYHETIGKPHVYEQFLPSSHQLLGSFLNQNTKYKIHPRTGCVYSYIFHASGIRLTSKIELRISIFLYI